MKNNPHEATAMFAFGSARGGGGGGGQMAFL